MMMLNLRFFLLLCLFALTSVSLSAQEDVSYSLRVPDAQEYLAALPGVIGQMQTSEDQSDNYELLRLLNEEFWMRYDDLSHVSLNVLNAAEPYMDRTFDYDVSNPKTEPGWHNLLLNVWLKEFQPDLSTRDIWQFDNYVLHVQPVDFTGDGIDELAVQFVYQPEDHAQFTEYLVLRRDNTQPQGYLRLGETNFWFSARCPYQLSCGGEGDLRQILDVTGDGLPEWVASRGSCGWGRCAVSLYVFGWWQGQFVDLTQVDQIWMPVVSGGGGPPTYPPQGDWIFENRDDDSALEITQVERVADNRGCDFSSEQIFNWDDTTGQFQGEEVVYRYADTPLCALRQAHQAMIDGNPEIAITYYEHMLTFKPPPDLTDLWQYARIRLVVAYALSERIEDAKELLNEIDPTTIEDEIIQTMVEVAQTALATHSDGKQLCAILFEAVADGYNKAMSAPTLLTYGQTNDYAVSWNYGGGDFSPANAACSIYSLWERRVDELSEDQGSLVDQIESAGWNVVAKFEFDINNDGINEILAWNDLSDIAAFQYSDNGQLHYSMATIRQPSAYSQVEMVSLPGTGNFLVSISFNPNIECQIDRIYQPGEIVIWRLEGDHLINIGGSEICEPQTIEETFSNSGEMRLKSTLYGDNLVLYWDAEGLVFTSPPENYFATESLAENPLSCYQSIYNFCGSLENPIEALTLIDVVLTTPQENSSSQFVTAFSYYRALALEALNRPDEALAEYVAIYETAPDSAWGMLAALHLEVIETE